MDERSLREEELANVSGGVAGREFSRIAEEFAWKNQCADCPHRNIYRAHSMCLEVYDELLQNYSRNNPIGARCERRK